MFSVADVGIDFNPRTPCGVRRWRRSVFYSIGYFNPRTPCGVRLHRSHYWCRYRRYFNPRTPCGVRQNRLADLEDKIKFQSTHPVWSATTLKVGVIYILRISIHAPRVECDGNDQSDNNQTEISIHAPRVECDDTNKRCRLPPVHFNPRTPCGVRHREWR